MRRTRWFRWLTWAAAALVGLIAAAYFAIESDWGRRRALRTLVERVNRTLRGELSVGSIQGSVLGDVTLHDVALTLEGETAFAAETVRVRYSSWQLSVGELGLKAVT